MRRGETARRLSKHAPDLRRRSRLAQPLPQRRPLDVLHREVDAIVVRPHLVHGDHVGMRQPRQRPRLGQHAPLHLGAIHPQHLERDHAGQLGITGAVHRPHATSPDPLEDLVAADPNRVLTPEEALLERSRQQTIVEAHGELDVIPVFGLGFHGGSVDHSRDYLSVLQADSRRAQASTSGPSKPASAARSLQ